MKKTILAVALFMAISIAALAEVPRGCEIATADATETIDLRISGSWLGNKSPGLIYVRVDQNCTCTFPSDGMTEVQGQDNYLSEDVPLVADQMYIFESPGDWIKFEDAAGANIKVVAEF
jgi:hypothetical protein